MAEAVSTPAPAAAAAPVVHVKEEKESAPVKPKETAVEGSEKKLCTYSKKPCAQRRMDGYAHCVKHILEDPTAPFAQCEHVAKNTAKRCTIPVPLKEPEPRYCSSHKQALGLAPPSNKKSPAKRDRSKKAGSSVTGKPLIAVLKKAGIMHSAAYLPKMTEGEDSDSASSLVEDSDEQEAPLSSSDSEEEAVYDAFMSAATADEPDVDLLKDSSFVTEEELVRRRQAKVRRLLKLYKTQFTRLRGVLKLKHRRFLREKQRRSDAPQRKELKEQEASAAPTVAAKEKAALKEKLSVSYHGSKVSKAAIEKPAQRQTCTVEGCSARCMPLLKFCYAHVLHDPAQKLFKGCPYTCNDGQQCSFPILHSQELCPAHLEREQRDAPKKEGRKRKTKDKDGPAEPKAIRPKLAPQQASVAPLPPMPAAAVPVAAAETKL